MDMNGHLVMSTDEVHFEKDLKYGVHNVLVW